jgi:hypothetical protein
MVRYHLDADKEFDDILRLAGRDLKSASGR